jgi:gluconate 2-dehydrogenase alpha chain
MTPDVCIVGMGAAGSVAAYALAEAGLRVLVLEAGQQVTTVDARPDELHSAVYANAGYSPKFNLELQTWRPGPDGPTMRATYSLGKMANGVGGGTLIYGTWMRRYQPHDFAIRAGTVARYGERAIPAGANLVDWPLTYDDLEPYYCRAERMMGVAGDPAQNPFEPRRSAPLPLPPARRTGTGELFAAACRRLGYHPFPVPTSVNTEPYDERPACTYCGWCTFYVCHNDAKTHAGNSFARKALASGHVELRTGCRVVGIEHAGRRVTAVRYVDPEGAVVRQEAPLFVLSSYTFENVRLLLTAGLGGPNVGKWFMTKQYVQVLGLFEGRRLNRWVAPAACATILDDFVGDNFDHTGLGFVRGATISCEEQLQPIGAARTLPPPGMRRWGAAYKAHLVKNWNSIADLRIQPETLPYEDTFLDLDPNVRDRSGVGMPVVRITWDLHENERRMIDFLEEKVRGILREMGADLVWAGPRITGVGSAHDLGGLRMGADPATSVVDPQLRLHEAPNLYVMSGGVFPSQAGINPTLTLQALVWRACEQLVQERQHGA